MDIKLPHNFLMYETSYGNDIPSEQLFLTQFNAVPSKYATRVNYDLKLADYLIENGFKELARVTVARRNDNASDRLFVNEFRKMFMILTSKKDLKEDLLQIEYIFDISNGELSEQINLEEIKKFERAKKKLTSI